MQKVPNFLVVGAPKSGTTSLYYYLKSHPQVFLPKQKELHYFSYENLAACCSGPGDKYILKHLCATSQEYFSHYNGSLGKHAVGDISPSYLYFAESAIPKIKAEIGNPKIIIMLRRHVDKVYSQYMHLVSEGRETLDFAQALAAESDRIATGFSDFWHYRKSTIYYPKIKLYLDAFGMGNVKIILIEEFSKNPTQGVADICRFLQIDDQYKPDTETIYNASGLPKSRILSRILGPGPFYSFIKTFVPSSIGAPLRASLIKLNRGRKPEISAEQRNALTEYFETDQQVIEQLIGRSWPNKG